MIFLDFLFEVKVAERKFLEKETKQALTSSGRTQLRLGVVRSWPDTHSWAMLASCWTWASAHNTSLRQVPS